jgi:hypothetical protein
MKRFGLLKNMVLQTAVTGTAVPLSHGLDPTGSLDYVAGEISDGKGKTRNGKGLLASD